MYCLAGAWTINKVDKLKVSYFNQLAGSTRVTGHSEALRQNTTITPRLGSTDAGSVESTKSLEVCDCEKEGVSSCSASPHTAGTSSTSF
jgi:hypothetical protein